MKLPPFFFFQNLKHTNFYNNDLEKENMLLFIDMFEIKSLWGSKLRRYVCLETHHLDFYAFLYWWG